MYFDWITAKSNEVELESVAKYMWHSKEIAHTIKIGINLVVLFQAWIVKAETSNYDVQVEWHNHCTYTYR